MAEHTQTLTNGWTHTHTHTHTATVMQRHPGRCSHDLGAVWACRLPWRIEKMKKQYPDIYWHFGDRNFLTESDSLGFMRHIPKEPIPSTLRGGSLHTTGIRLCWNESMCIFISLYFSLALRSSEPRYLCVISHELHTNPWLYGKHVHLLFN